MRYRSQRGYQCVSAVRAGPVLDARDLRLRGTPIAHSFTTIDTLDIESASKFHSGRLIPTHQNSDLRDRVATLSAANPADQNVFTWVSDRFWLTCHQLQEIPRPLLFWIVEDLVGCALLHDSALCHEDNSISYFARKPDLVRYDDHGHPGFS